MREGRKHVRLDKCALNSPSSRYQSPELTNSRRCDDMCGDISVNFSYLQVMCMLSVNVVGRCKRRRARNASVKSGGHSTSCWRATRQRRRWTGPNTQLGPIRQTWQTTPQRTSKALNSLLSSLTTLDFPGLFAAPYKAENHRVKIRWDQQSTFIDSLVVWSIPKKTM